jgi:hypothetical protein
MMISVAMARNQDYTAMPDVDVRDYRISVGAGIRPTRGLRRSKLRLYGDILMWKKWPKSYKVAAISCTYIYNKDPASYVAEKS